MTREELERLTQGAGIIADIERIESFVAKLKEARCFDFGAGGYNLALFLSNEEIDCVRQVIIDCLLSRIETLQKTFDEL